MKRKIVTLMSAFLLGFTQVAYSEAVKKIHITGNSRLDKEAIINYLPFNVGDNPTRTQIDSAVKALLRSDLFANVKISSNGAGLYNVNVTENPIIAKIYFEGNDRYDDEALSAEVVLREGAMLTEARVKTSLLRLRELYTKSGRLQATITPEMIEHDDNRIDFIFKITEGEVVYVENINFLGNNAFSDSKLRSVIETSEEAWWRFFSSSSTYDEDRLSLDKSKLVEYYQQKGYIDFAVESATAELNTERNGFIIKFVVNEGKRYSINKVTINDTLTSVDKEDIFDEIDQSDGDYYNRADVRKNEEDIVLFLSEKGYPFVDVQGGVKRINDDTIDLTYHISETEPAYIERIEISGNSRTLEEVIRRRLSIVEGDPLNRSLLQKSERDLRGTGYFAKADFIERPGSQDGKVNMTVDVEEQSTGDVTFGVGFSTNNGPLGEISLSERNFLGRGQKVRVGALLSGRRKELDLSFTEPYLFGRQLSGGFDVYHITSNFRQEASYEEKSSGFVLRSGFMVIDDLSLSPRYRLNFDEINNLAPNVSAIVRDSANRGGLIGSSVGYEAIYDKRDDLLSPTEGYLLRLNTDLSGLGGDIKATKAIISAQTFYTPIPQFVLSLEGESGAVVPFGGYDLRIIDRHLLGGQSFRGFEVAGMGPRFIPTSGQNFNDDAIGGSYFSVARTELMFPIPGLDDSGISGALFNDTGTLWGVDNIPDLNSQGKIKKRASLRSSVGLGINWQSPMGPIRLDFAQPVLKEKYDRTQFFQFSGGSRF
jgi:outer membrane protein insertion porin family